MLLRIVEEHGDVILSGVCELDHASFARAVVPCHRDRAALVQKFEAIAHDGIVLHPRQCLELRDRVDVERLWIPFLQLFLDCLCRCSILLLVPR